MEKADINLMAQSMTVGVSQNADSTEILRSIEKIVKTHEPDVKVSQKEQEEPLEEENLKKKLVVYGIGILLFIVGLLLKEGGTLRIALLVAAYLIFGLEVLVKACKNIAKGQVFDENFLMSIATIGAFALGDLPEGVFVMLFYQIGELFQSLAVSRSRKSIRALMDIRPDYANLVTGNESKVVSPKEVEPGDLILVKPGEKIPLDGIVIEGTSQLNVAALTGEPVPRSVEENDEVLSGSINQTGVLKIKVTKRFGDSTVMKILELVENAAAKKTETEKFITKFAKVYTPIVVVLALLLAVMPPLFLPGAQFRVWIGRALIFLVVSCPCALVLSVPLTYFSGIGAASRRGILVKGSNFLQVLSKTSVVVFDKTGTLTKGVFSVKEVVPAAGVLKEELLRAAGVAESMSTHPIARAVYDYCAKEAPAAAGFAIEELSGRGVKAEKDGVQYLAGNERLMEQYRIPFQKYQGPGSLVYCAENGRFLGCIAVMDTIKEDSPKAVKKLKEIGLDQVVMLTGDNAQAAEAVGRELGMDRVYAGLLPKDKVDRMEEIMAQNNRGMTIFAGDGMNDAPVLTRADTGIAMGQMGTDAAIEAADVVIMSDEPSKIAEAILIARKTERIVKENIVFAIGVKILVLVLSAFGLSSMWMAVFADVGVAFLAVLNSLKKKTE